MVAAVSAPVVAARVADELVASLGGEPSERFGERHVTLAKERVREAVRHAREAGLEHLSDVMAIDWLEYPRHDGPRFTVVYNLYALRDASRLFLRVNVGEGEGVPSITPQWRAAGFFEREVYDLFGIEFDGHPDLRKLVTPDDLDGHPLRKDFPLGETPTLFNDGRFLDPATFRAGMLGRDKGRTGWVGGARKGVRSEQGLESDREGGS
jgi:NADH-quinone oxidoreductase subunit C